MGDAQNELLLDHDLVGVAAQGIFTAKYRAVVSTGKTALAILLVALCAGGTLLAAVDHAADTGEVADLELLDAGAHRSHPTDDFVARDRRIKCVVPFIARSMQIGVAHATVENVDLHIIVAWRAALELIRLEHVLGRLRCVAVSLDHECHLFDG